MKSFSFVFSNNKAVENYKDRVKKNVLGSETRTRKWTSKKIKVVRKTGFGYTKTGQLRKLTKRQPIGPIQMVEMGDEPGQRSGGRIQQRVSLQNFDFEQNFVNK